MCNESIDEEVNTPLQICTYVFKIQSEQEDIDDSDEIRTSIQSLLGPDHEVISASKMKFSTLCTDDSPVSQHVIKIKTKMPTHVATKFMGGEWVREDHVLFKASKPLIHTNIFRNNTK